MRYLAIFNEDDSLKCILHCNDEEELNSKSNYISETTKEITELQCNNSKYLSLVDNEIVFDTTSYDEARMDIIRSERDSKLTACDFVMLSDSQATEACKAAYETYRQSLRDFPSIVDLDDIVWPEEPEYATI